MKNTDKSGNKIYPKIFAKMQYYARILIKQNYLESKNKPNLFYKYDTTYKGVIYFADMRGANIVPIWEDPSPLFYVKFSKGLRYDLMNQIHEDEFNRLKICRNSEDYLPYSEGEDGFCVECDKYFGGNGEESYCSQCKEIIRKMQPDMEILNQPPCCGLCFAKDKKLIEHHLNYANNRVIKVCRNCHIKIHRGKDYDTAYLRSTDSRPKREKSNPITSKVCDSCQETFQPRNREQICCHKCIANRKKRLEQSIDWVTKTYG